MILAFRLAWRELRWGPRGLWIVLLCLALGVGVIAAVGTLHAATDEGLATDGRRIEVKERSRAVLNSLAVSVVEEAFSVTVIGLDQVRAVVR